MQNIEKIKSFDKAILFIDKIFNLILQDIEKNREILYEILYFNIEIAEKHHEYFKKIYKFVKTISEMDYDESYYSEETDLSFIALNTVHGMNFRCYMDHLTKISKIDSYEKEFLSYILDKNNEERFCCFYYYLGMQYQYLSIQFTSLNLFKRVTELGNKARVYFLYGYLSYFNYIPSFKDLKTMILNSFINNEITQNEVRRRFVQMLLFLKLHYNEDELYNEFCQYFSEEDYKNSLHGLVYKKDSNYKKETVLKYWEKIISLKNRSYTSYLLAIFNKYCSFNEIEQYEEQLENIIDSGLPDSLVANRSFQQFLENLLSFLKENKKCATTYNILDKFIIHLSTVKYYYKELDTIKEILYELKNQQEETNARLLAKRIYETPNIKYYSTNLKEFL